MLDEMKEVVRSEHSEVFVKTNSSSECLIIKKRVACGGEEGVGFSDSSSKSLLNSTEERKRPRLVLGDSESSDKSTEPLRRKIDRFDNGSVNGLMENKEKQTKERVNNGLDMVKYDELDERRITKDDRQSGDQREYGNGSNMMVLDKKRDLCCENKSSMLGVKSSGCATEDDRFQFVHSVLNENQKEGFDERVRLEGENGVLKVIDKDKPVGVSHRSNDHGEAADRKEQRPGVVKEKRLSRICKIREQLEAKDRQGSTSGEAMDWKERRPGVVKKKRLSRISKIREQLETKDRQGSTFGDVNKKKTVMQSSSFLELDERRIRKDVNDDRQSGDQRESGNGTSRIIDDKKRDLFYENKSRMLGVKSSGCAIEDDRFQFVPSASNENKKEGFDERVGLEGENGVLKVVVDKDKLAGVSHRSNDHGETADWKERRPGVIKKKRLSRICKIREQLEAKDRQGSTLGDANKKKTVMQSSIGSKINPRTGNVSPLIGKRSERKRDAFTEKQLLREKIKSMLLGAGWTIDKRPRKNRDYLDSVYISPTGGAYWSITKAYEALRKKEKEKDSSKDGGDFTPLPNEILSKLTRQTRKKIEKELKMNKRHEDNIWKAKRDRLRMSSQQVAGDRLKEKFGSYRHGRRLEEDNQESGDYSSDSSEKETPKKDGAVKMNFRTNSHIVQGRKSRKIGRCTLLVRGSDKELNSENNGFVPKRTMISWLIDSGTVCAGEKVQYMNLRRTRVMQEGWITNDGIHCGCCSKIVTVLRFELHAGSKLSQPFRNIFVQSGQSLMQCQIDAWNKQEESERKGFHVVDVDGDDPNDDTCGLCGDGGDLICCDGCPSTFHLSCLDMQMLPLGDWHCPNCACKYCEIVGGNCTKASSRTGRSLLTCRLCEKKYHKSCSLKMDGKPTDFNDLNSTFCGQECRELYSRLQKLLWIKHELDSGFSWSLIRQSYPLSDGSLAESSQRAECNSKLAIALVVMDECFLPIVDRRSGISLIHNVVYSCGSNISRLNYSGFFTAILERGDEIICAASIRIHGTHLAEMPFIATRHIYRRQGMCRRLFDAIESALSSLEVEKLVIPAIAEHLHTWTNSFGFSPLEESHKDEMRCTNMLVFPGTDMLQKPLTSKKGNKGFEVEDNNKSAAKKPESNNTTMQNGLEILFSRKKSDERSNTHVAEGPVQDENKTSDGIANSCSKAEKIALQDGNGTAIGITNADSPQPEAPNGVLHDIVSLGFPSEPQVRLAANDSVSGDADFDSIVVRNGTRDGDGDGANIISPQVLDTGKESESVDADSDSKEKEFAVQIASNGISDFIAGHSDEKMTETYNTKDNI